MKSSFWFFLAMIIVGAVGAGLWLYQTKSFSKEILKLEILGPDQAKLAEEVEYLVKFKNNGEVNLEDARLTFEYPQHSLLLEGEGLREERGLETIYPGQERTLSFKTRLFGKEGEQKVAKAWLKFRPKNLQGHFESATTKTTLISQVPLTLEFDLPTKAEAGKEVRFRLNYFSNAAYPLSGLRVMVEYPSDFEFLEAKPFSLEKNEWEIGLLNKAEGGRVEIAGKFSGEIGEEKLLRAKIGMWRQNEFVLLKETVRGVEIAPSRLFISQQINGRPRYTASPGDSLHYEIFFKNIGAKPLTNLFLVAKLEGRAFDFETLKTEEGKFTVGDNSIIFDSRDLPNLRFLDSQEEGRVEFWVELKEEWPILGPQDKDAILKNTVLLSQAREEFVTKVNSRLVISQTGSFDDEVFGNTGPPTPRVGETTTFTMIWQAKNYYNEVSNVRVRAALPPQVRLTGEIFPEGAPLTFDSESRELVWEVGEMMAGEGVITEAPNIAFQIAFTPDETQRGEKGALMLEAEISGEDEWTNELLQDLAPAIEITVSDETAAGEE